jgi:glycosyltransferase involved in cell wall biosynthesis
MPVYNGAKYVEEAIRSILAQTFHDFEFLIINDGSTDNSEEIILSFTDPRIRYIKNETNLKLIATLNKGLKLARGKYIARMDADDISLPDRLQLQVDFMEEHTEVGVCGSFIKNIGAENNTVLFLTSHNEITFRQIFSTYIRHPTALIRKQVLIDNNIEYRFEYPHVEDHRFWIDISLHSKLAILPKVLLHYRIHSENISVTQQATQAKIETLIRKEQIERLGITLTDEEMHLFNAFINLIRIDGNIYLRIPLPENVSQIIQLNNLLERIVLANRAQTVFNPQVLEWNFAQAYKKLVIHLTGFGPGIINTTVRNRVFDRFPFTIQEKLKLYLKAIWHRQYDYNTLFGLTGNPKNE